MTNYRLSEHVEARMRGLLEKGTEPFGNIVRDKYARLILRALQDVADEPNRPGTTSDPAIDPDVIFYHLRYSRLHLAPDDRIGNPRHLIVYQIGFDGMVEILGLIPDMIPSEIALRRFIPERF